MPRQTRPPIPPAWHQWLADFDLALESVGRSAKTRSIYRDAIGWFVATLPPDVTDWGATVKVRRRGERDEPVVRQHLQQFFVDRRRDGYKPGYINQLGRSIQAFDKWFATEEGVPRIFGERLPVPPPPDLDDSPPPIIAIEQLAALIQDAEAGRDFESRRDAALLRLYACTGSRLSELLLDLGDLDHAKREITVTGKAGKVRTVRYNPKAATAITRYLRVRGTHPHANEATALWLGIRRRAGLTANGVYQMVSRRGERLGLRIHPHLFRHTFVHQWLDNGGKEGDLMELMGWDSPQMLRRYGRAARGARARRAYDEVDVMGGV